MIVAPGSTDVRSYPQIGTTGLDVTQFQLRYVRDGSAPSEPVYATDLAAIDSDHTDYGAKEMAWGMYRVDWPDAAFANATGVKHVQLLIQDQSGDTASIDVDLLDVSATTGTGTATFTCQILDNLTGDPIPYADTWITADSAGTDSAIVVLTQRADGAGWVTYNVTADSYWLHARKDTEYDENSAKVEAI